LDFTTAEMHLELQILCRRAHKKNPTLSSQRRQRRIVSLINRSIIQPLGDFLQWPK